MKEQRKVSQGRKTKQKTCYGYVKTSRLLEEFRPDQVERGEKNRGVAQECPWYSNHKKREIELTTEILGVKGQRFYTMNCDHVETLVAATPAHE